MAELVGCDRSRLDDASWLAEKCAEACRLAGATVLGVQHHQFVPQGASALVLLAESHLSIHTWPEHGYASLDIYTCGVSLCPERAAWFLAEKLGARRTVTIDIVRGLHRLDADGRARFGEEMLEIRGPIDREAAPRPIPARAPRRRARSASGRAVG
ncbi:MAG: adenosylmethionine decarboxylase [Planctomycetes bacterium]|nr:adenosylmethionine decarboxylase [Planctomycetota bacterium]